MSVVFDFIKQILAIPLGFILSLLYDLTSNYILAIALLTVLVKLCFLPNAISQQKSLVKTAEHNKKTELLKSKYQNEPDLLKAKLAAHKEKQPETKLGLGCLTTLIHLVVLIGLFGVIYTPLTNVLHIEKDTVAEMKLVMTDVIENEDNSGGMPEIILMKEAETYKDELLSENILTEEKLNEVITFSEKYNFMGIDLAKTPELSQFNELWIVPALVFLTSMLMPLRSFILRKKQNPNGPKFAAIEALPFISPMMMFLFAFIISAGVGLYWATSSLISFVQTLVLGAIYNPTKISVSIDEEEIDSIEAPLEMVK